MTDDAILELIRTHGAKRCSDAAYLSMQGRPASAQALGLGGLTLPGLHRVAVLAYRLMPAEDQATDLAEAVIAASKLP